MAHGEPATLARHGEDQRPGFVPEAVSVTSTGLALMRTRLKRVGGRCELQTTPGMGTRLTIVTREMIDADLSISFFSVKGKAFWDLNPVITMS